MSGKRMEVLVISILILTLSMRVSNEFDLI